jgi:TatD DNase family protein
MEFFDTHTHLESARFDPDRAEVIHRAHDAGVMRMVTCGSDLESSAGEIALAASWPGLYAAVGIHGHRAFTAADDAGAVDEAAMARLAALAGEPGVVAIGEIGLDYYYDFSPRVAQQAVMAHQLRLAAERGLPVILHNREADEDTRRLLEEAPPLRGVLHCFLADAAMADWAVARDLYIGIAGPITFKNVRHLPDIVRRVPHDRLLIETDCPYLAPHPMRGRRNEPAYVPHVATRVAEVLSITVEELAQRTTGNARRLFGVP